MSDPVRCRRSHTNDGPPGRGWVSVSLDTARFEGPGPSPGGESGCTASFRGQTTLVQTQGTHPDLVLGVEPERQVTGRGWSVSVTGGLRWCGSRSSRETPPVQPPVLFLDTVGHEDPGGRRGGQGPMRHSESKEETFDPTTEQHIPGLGGSFDSPHHVISPLNLRVRPPVLDRLHFSRPVSGSTTPRASGLLVPLDSPGRDPTRPTHRCGSSDRQP